MSYINNIDILDINWDEKIQNIHINLNQLSNLYFLICDEN